MKKNEKEEEGRQAGRRRQAELSHSMADFRVLCFTLRGPVNAVNYRE
jgi:hypothetical protein